MVADDHRRPQQNRVIGDLAVETAASDALEYKESDYPH